MLKSKFVKLYITAYEVELCLRLILKDKHEHVCDQHNIHAVTINRKYHYSSFILLFFQVYMKMCHVYYHVLYITLTITFSIILFVVN